MPNCIREAEGFVVVYDATQPEQTQKQLADFILEIERGKMDYLLDDATLKKANMPFAPICLAVNKIDLIDPSNEPKLMQSAMDFAKQALQFQSADAKKAVTSKGHQVIVQTSAKKNLNITEAFNSVIAQVIQYRELKNKPPKDAKAADSKNSKDEKKKKGGLGFIFNLISGKKKDEK